MREASGNRSEAEIDSMERSPKGERSESIRCRAREEDDEAGEVRPAGDSGVAPRLATALHDAGARFGGSRSHRVLKICVTNSLNESQEEDSAFAERIKQAAPSKTARMM